MLYCFYTGFDLCLIFCIYIYICCLDKQDHPACTTQATTDQQLKPRKRETKEEKEADATKKAARLEAAQKAADVFFLRDNSENSSSENQSTSADGVQPATVSTSVLQHTNQTLDEIPESYVALLQQAPLPPRSISSIASSMAPSVTVLQTCGPVQCSPVPLTSASYDQPVPVRHSCNNYQPPAMPNLQFTPVQSTGSVSSLSLPPPTSVSYPQKSTGPQVEQINHQNGILQDLTNFSNSQNNSLPGASSASPQTFHQLTPVRSPSILQTSQSKNNLTPPCTQQRPPRELFAKSSSRIPLVESVCASMGIDIHSPDVDDHINNSSSRDLSSESIAPVHPVNAPSCTQCSELKEKIKELEKELEDTKKEKTQGKFKDLKLFCNMDD